VQPPPSAAARLPNPTYCPGNHSKPGSGRPSPSRCPLQCGADQQQQVESENLLLYPRKSSRAGARLVDAKRRRGYHWLTKDVACAVVTAFRRGGAHEHDGRITKPSSAVAAPGHCRTGWGGHERGRVGGERGSSVGCHAFADHGLTDDGQRACGRDAAICGDRPLLGLEHESDHDFGDVVDLGHRRSDYFQHFGFSRSGHGSGDRVGDDHCYGSDDPRRGYGDFDGHAEGVAGGDGVAGGGERAGGRNGPADGHG
jgi:hypothetical protein